MATRLVTALVVALALLSAPAASAAGRLGVVSNAARYRAVKVSRALARKARGRPVMTVARERDARSYARDLRDTVEILFQPRASDYGHVLVRIGEAVYDMPNAFGARAQKFHEVLRYVHSPMYGFVFDSTPQRIAELDLAFRRLIASRPAFSPSGSGPDGFSCASFVTSILSSRAPELRVGLGIAATGVASDLLGDGAHQAMTLYGTAAAEAGSETFSFERLE